MNKTKSIIVGTITIASLVVVTLAGQQAWAWDLTVDLSASTFGSDQVCASVEGGYGYGPVRECTNPGRSAQVTFNLGNSIEEGENYHVCAWGGLASAIFKNCEYFSHGSGDESVSMNVGG